MNDQDQTRRRIDSRLTTPSMIQDTIHQLLLFALIIVQDLAVIRRQRSGTLRRVMSVSQGQEYAIPLIQPQGNMQLHLPTTGIHMIHHSPLPTLKTPHRHIVRASLALCSWYSDFSR